MKFNRNLDWLKESDEENLLEDDELDSVKPDINEADRETTFIDIVGDELSRLSDRQIYDNLKELFTVDAILRNLAISLDSYDNEPLAKQSTIKKIFDIANKHYPQDKGTMYYELSKLKKNSNTFKQIMNKFDNVDKQVYDDEEVMIFDDDTLTILINSICNVTPSILAKLKSNFAKAYNVFNSIKDISDKKDKSKVLSILKTSFDTGYKDLQTVLSLAKANCSKGIS